jgi:hypothetical protein
MYWLLTLREESRLTVFENRVLRKIFGPKKDEETAAWRRLQNEELNGLYSSPNIIQAIKSRRMRGAGHVASIGEWKGACRALVWKSDEKRTLGRPRHRREDNNLMDLVEVEWWAGTGLIWLSIGTSGKLL